MLKVTARSSKYIIVPFTNFYFFYSNIYVENKEELKEYYGEYTPEDEDEEYEEIKVDKNIYLRNISKDTFVGFFDKSSDKPIDLSRIEESFDHECIVKMTQHLNKGFLIFRNDFFRDNSSVINIVNKIDEDLNCYEDGSVTYTIENEKESIDISLIYVNYY